MSVGQTSLFRDLIFHRENDPIAKRIELDPGQVLLRFEAQVSFLRPDEDVYVSGSIPELGNWEPAKSVKLVYNKPNFVLMMALARGTSFEWKYHIKKRDTGEIVRWEITDNRYTELNENETVISGEYRGGEINWHGFGVAIPVFSLRTDNGMGVGEFLDLKPFIDLTAKLGGVLIQLLPINDTSCTGTWIDSYPYSALSVNSLHPIYLNLQQLTTDKALLSEIKTLSEELNDLHEIDYERVITEKKRLVRLIYAQRGTEVRESKPFKHFVSDNEEWILPYAAFIHWSNAFGSTNWQEWDEEYKNPTPEKLQKWQTANEESFGLTLFTQYFLHEQLSDVVNYARTKRVGLKGDLPIGVNPKSADTWQYPHLFHLDMSTGAPPDLFSADGQNWGFPTYNWDEMAKDDYLWWKRRLRQMSLYFQALRIDHVLGFFRIWEIPASLGQSGLLGHFSPSIPVHIHELKSRGLWDIERYTQPYITEYYLREKFGNHFDCVVGSYFHRIGEQRYALQDYVSTEKKILEYVDKLPTQDPLTKCAVDTVKEVLTTCVKNVVLLRDYRHNPWENFFPRINVDKTSSFQDLSDHEKMVLWDIYLDYYYRRQEHLWSETGWRRLPMIRGATDMLVCAEDLGMVPNCVAPVMDGLGILSLRIQRMPADNNILFQHPADYPYMSVCTTSTHDCTTIRGWWEEDGAKTQEFWTKQLGLGGRADQFASVEICKKIMDQHLFSTSMWAIIPLQDLFALVDDLRVTYPLSERINDPGNSHHYWRYRMHVSIDHLLHHDHFTSMMSGWVRACGRHRDD